MLKLMKQKMDKMDGGDTCRRSPPCALIADAAIIGSEECKSAVSDRAEVMCFLRRSHFTHWMF